MAMSGLRAKLLRLLRAAREAHAAQNELWERYLRRQRPWEEDWLHWTVDDTWRLSGTLLPPVSRADRRWAKERRRRAAWQRPDTGARSGEGTA